MYSDGILGNQGVLNTLGILTNAVFNYMRAPNTSPYSLKSILHQSHDYIYGEEKADPSESLKLFMTQAQGFSMDRFKRE